MSTTLTLGYKDGEHIHPDEDEIDLRQQKANVTVTLTMSANVAKDYRFMTADESTRYGLVFANAGGFESTVFSNWAANPQADPPTVTFTAANSDQKTWAFWLFIVKRADSTVLLIDPSIRDK